MSIGSNIDPTRHVRVGLVLLREHFGELRTSPVYESRAVGFDGENFLNLVVAFDTDETVYAVNDVLHRIEARCGRRRGGTRFAPRALDLDLLLYGDLTIHDQGVRVPREEILHYAFVLRPLADLIGERRHPQDGRTFRELWDAFDAPEQVLWPATETIV